MHYRPGEALSANQPRQNEEERARLTLEDLLRTDPAAISPSSDLDETLYGVIAMLHLESRVATDEELRTVVERTGNERHYMVDLRKRALALAALLPFVGQIPPIDTEELESSLDERAPEHGMARIASIGLFLAAGEPRPSSEYLQQDGPEKVNTLKFFFQEDALSKRSLYEFQTGERTYGTYEAEGGKMDRRQFEAAMAYAPTPDEMLAVEPIINPPRRYTAPVGLDPAQKAFQDMRHRRRLHNAAKAAARVKYGSGSPEAVDDWWVDKEAFLIMINERDW